MADWGKAEFDQFYRFPAERYGRPGDRPAIVVHYHDYVVLSGQRTIYAPRLANILGLVSGQAVVLVGAGFNATAEGLGALGIRAIGTDLSTYIQQQKGQTEEAEIRAAIQAAGLDPDVDLIHGPNGHYTLDPLEHLLRGGRNNPQPRGWGQILGEEMRTKGSRNAVLNAFQSQFGNIPIRYIITEEVLNSITDAEASLVCDYASAAASEWGATVVHVLSPKRFLEDGVTPSGANHAGLNWKTYAEWRAWLDANGYGSHLIIPSAGAEWQGLHSPDHATIYARAYADRIAEQDQAGVPRDEFQAVAEATAFADRHVAVGRVEAYSGLL